METPNNYYLNFKVTSSVISQVDIMYHGYDTWEWQFSFLAFPPKHTTTVELWEKHWENPSLGEPYKITDQYSPKWKGHQEQENSEKLSHPRGVKETQGLNVIQYPVTGKIGKDYGYLH